MGKKKPRISTEEKRRLILAYYDSGETVKDFCNKHLLCRASFDRWLKAYHGQGTSGLISPTEKACEKIAPQLKTESDLRMEILKLRIENERLKKRYMVKKTEDGQTEYIRLKPKNSK